MTTDAASIEQWERPNPLVRWMRAHPRILDGIVVVLCVGLQWMALLLTGESVDPLAYSALGIAGLALLWRRRSPFLVMVVVALVATIAVLFDAGHTYQGMPTAFALYAVAAAQTTRRALVGYVVAVGLPLLAGAAHGLWSGSAFSPSVFDPFALLALVIGFAVRARRERSQATAALVEEQVRAAALTERARITAEMHDVVAHSITVMIALAGGARAGWEKHPERARDALDHLGDVGATALEEIQRILRVLSVDDPGLDSGLHASGHNVPSLAELVEVFRAAGLPVTLVQHGDTATADAALGTTIHRIVQESLTNALRYAQGATEVRVEISRHPSMIDITVTDDGAPASRQPSVGAGAGLIGMRERAVAFGGTSTAGHTVSGGWFTTTQIPLPTEASDER